MVELVVVLAITGILTAMAIPQYARYVGSRTIDAQVSSLVSALRVARSEALKRAIPVTICPSADPEAAAPQCSPSNATQGWATGWLIFVDLNTRGTVDGSDAVIKVQSAFTNSGGIIPSAGANYTITFTANGITTGNLGNTFIFKNKASPDDASLNRNVCISAQGTSRFC